MSKLHEILEDQHTEARREAGRTIVRKLPRGLRVEMCCVLNDVVVTITRDNTFPSAEEWRTIYKYLPFFADFKEPLRVEQKGRYILTATFKLQPPNQLKFI